GSAEQGGMGVVEGFRAGGVVGGGVIGGCLVIDRRQLELGPIRLGHLPPGAERGEPPFEQPFRLLFFRRDEPDGLFREARRRRLGFDIGNKAVFVARLRKRAYGLQSFCRGWHAEKRRSSGCDGIDGAAVRRMKAAGVSIASSVTADSASPTARLIAAQCGLVGQ